MPGHDPALLLQSVRALMQERRFGRASRRLDEAEAMGESLSPEVRSELAAVRRDLEREVERAAGWRGD
jgi:hypothetical protein